MDLRLSHTTYRQSKVEFIDFRNLNRDDVRDETYFDWRYSKRPNDSEPIIVFARGERDEIIGSFSIIPHRYAIDNSTRCLGVVGDISVRQEFRGKGIATKMLAYIDKIEELRKCECNIVLPNIEASIPLQRTGWRRVSSLQRFVKVIDTNYLFEKKAGLSLFGTFFSGVADKILDIISEKKEIPEAFSFRITGRVNEEFDSLWDNLDKRGLIIGFRNRAYLEWRYLSHPLVEYKVFSFNKNGELCGYIVFHSIEERVFQIDDILCSDFKKDIGYLFSSFFKYLRCEEKAALLFFKANDNHLINSRLKKHGFIKRDDQDFMIYPWNRGDALIHNGANWFITAGDKDI